MSSQRRDKCSKCKKKCPFPDCKIVTIFTLSPSTVGNGVPQVITVTGLNLNTVTSIVATIQGVQSNVPFTFNPNNGTLVLFVTFTATVNLTPAILTFQTRPGCPSATGQVTIVLPQ